MLKIPSRHYRTLLFAVLALIVVVGGCKKKPVAPTPPPPPPPPAAKPTVALRLAPATIQKGEAITLTWSSTDATKLVLMPEVGDVAPDGSTKVAPSATTTYTISAVGPGGSAEASASVTVTQPPPPPPPPPPPVVVEPTIEELFAREVQSAYYDYNKADVRADARDALTKDADFLRRYPQVKVTINGNCDERGSTEYNLALGDRRAQAARQFLISLGISADRMTTVSFGKEKPVCEDHNEECWQKNRNATFVMAH